MNELASVDFVELSPEELGSQKHHIYRGGRQLSDEAKAMCESMFPRYTPVIDQSPPHIEQSRR